MTVAFVVFNAGSSSVKFAVYGASAELPLLYRGQVSNFIDQPKLTVQDAQGNLLIQSDSIEAGHDAALFAILGWLGSQGSALDIQATGHRVVHGGVKFSRPVQLSDAVLHDLETFIPMAPLHQPANLDAARAVLKHYPKISHWACFDTAFHRDQARVAQQFPIPSHYYEEGVLRYGFHGLSYEFIASQLPNCLGHQADGRVIAAHLGNGASLCAMHQCQSVATTMGFTALDGLMMGTRSGAIDPGLVLYLLQEKGLSTREVSDLLYYQSGLKGVSELTHDVSVLMASESPRAAQALDLFCTTVARQLAGLIPTLGGLDAIVFTAGIGEHAAPVRRAVCNQLGWLGLKLDSQANQAYGTGVAALHSSESAVQVFVIPTREELMVAKHLWAGLHPEVV